MQSWARLAALLQAGLATTAVSPACSYSFTPISVGPSFRVKVSGEDGPVKGLRVKLTESVSAVTDASGIAHFYGVPGGTYYVEADRGGVAQLDVKPNGRSGVVVPMMWPALKPIRVRSLSGTMRAPGFIPGGPDQRALSLELLAGISGRVLSSITATTRGEFDFGPLVPGLYFIHLMPYPAFRGELVEGDISVAVDPAAPAGRLDLDLTWSSCGLSYIDQRQCPQPDLHVKKLEGHVSDSNGAAVGRGVIVLLDASQNQVASVSPGRDGNFSFDGALAGTFELWMGMSGLSPVHTPIQIEPTASVSSLEIEAAYGTCSAIRAQ